MDRAAYRRDRGESRGDDESDGDDGWLCRVEKEQRRKVSEKACFTLQYHHTNLRMISSLLTIFSEALIIFIS